MDVKTIFYSTIIAICMIVYGFFAVQRETGPEFAVSVDLGRPLSIEWPCETSIVGDNGEKGLRIAPKVGRGWRGEAGGQASYRFYIPEDGKYHIWAYCLWYDECANAVFAQIDDLDKAIVGNDPIYNKWHWVRGFDVSLKKGTHSLLLSNHSDHIALQKVAFSNSSYSNPQQAGLVFSDIFYDGFDGCDQGNFASWHQESGSWLVQNPDSETCFIENCLIGHSQDKAFIAYKNTNWQNYSLDISIKIPTFDSVNGAVGICFGLTDLNDFYQLKIQPIPNSNKAKIALIDKNSEIISEFKLTFEINKWQQIQIAIEGEQVNVKIAQNKPVKIKANHKVIGGIGFALQGESIVAYFDNVHVRQIFQTRNN